MGKRITLKECKDLAKERNGKCLSTVYKGAPIKMRWECEKGHEWVRTFAGIKGNKKRKGSWCSDCNGRRKLTLDDCKEAAKNHRGKCLSTEYGNSHTKMKWQCEKGHEWPAKFYHIKYGTWCPTCSHIKLVNLNSTFKTRCEDGHVFQTTLKEVREGSWCPDKDCQ